jgi:hypothetical protein
VSLKPSKIACSSSGGDAFRFGARLHLREPAPEAQAAGRRSEVKRERSQRVHIGLTGSVRTAVAGECGSPQSQRRGAGNALGKHHRASEKPQPTQTHPLARSSLASLSCRPTRRYAAAALVSRARARSDDETGGERRLPLGPTATNLETHMKYIVAWALGVPAVVILAWIVFF